MPAGVSSRLVFLESAVDGDLQRETDDLRTGLQHAQASNEAINRKVRAVSGAEILLSKEEKGLEDKLVEAHADEATMRRQLRAGESSLREIRAEVAETRKGLQMWQRKASALQGELVGAQDQRAKAEEEAQQWHRSYAKADNEVGTLHQALTEKQQQVQGLKSTQEHLQQRLQEEVSWHKSTQDKMHRFKAAELSLVEMLETSERTGPAH